MAGEMTRGGLPAAGFETCGACFRCELEVLPAEGAKVPPTAINDSAAYFQDKSDYF